MRALRAILSAVGWGILGVLALAGVTLSGLAAFAALPVGRPLVASTIIRFASAELAGSLRLGGVEVRPGGAIAIHGLEAYDPEGELVLQVDHAIVSADLTRLRNKAVGLTVELDGASILVDEDKEGRLSLARAFAPAHPAPARPVSERGKQASWEDLGGWTIRLRRLTVRNASLWWRNAAGDTLAEVQDLSLDARALAGPRRIRAELSVHASAYAPVEGPLALEVRALLDGDHLRVPVLRAQLAGTGLSGLADADLAKLTGRAALTRATVDRAQAKALVKQAPAGADLAFQAYADADGKVASAALHVEPQAGDAAGQGGGGVGGDAAVAVRTDGSRAIGFDVATRALDPSALLSAAPPGSVTLTARGGLAGRTFSDARGGLALDLARSRLRAGELGPATAAVRLDRGSVEAQRLSLVAPGVHVEGSGSWRQGGAAAAQLVAEVADLGLASTNVGALLGAALPRLSGKGRVQASLSGTTAAPVVTAELTAPRLEAGAVAAEGLVAHGSASGPFRPGQLRVEVRAERLASGGRTVAQAMSLRAEVSPAQGQPGAAAGTLSASGLVPSLGKDPVTVEAAGVLPADRKTLRLTQLELGYPGTRYALADPALLTFAGPRVDRLQLVSGPRSIALQGGLGTGAGRPLDATLEVVKLDLAKLPAGVLPPEDRIAGELTAEVRARGSVARPELEARLALERGGFRTEQGVDVKGTLGFDGAARRATGKLALARAKGGKLEVEADLPVPLRDRPREKVAAEVRFEGVPLVAILELAGTDQPVSGKLSGAVKIAGSAGAPTAHGQVAVADGVFRDLQGVGLDATTDLGLDSELEVELSLAGQRSAKVQVRAPLRAAALAADPAAAMKGLREARLTADAELTGLDLAALAGRLGVPAGLRGKVTGEVHLAGQPLAPRGTLALAFEGGALDEWAGVGGRLEASAREDRVEAHVKAQLDGQELLDLTAALRAPVERLTTRAGFREAGLTADGTVPRVDLAKTATRTALPLGGAVEAKLHATGTVSHPDVELHATGSAITFQSHPVGNVRLEVHAGGERATAELHLDPPAGGELVAGLAVRAPVSLDLDGKALRAAPAEASLRATAVDLSFLPALAPSAIRAAAGKLDADLSAKGPLAELVPRGTARLTGGRLGLLEYGEWTGIALDGAVTEDAVEVRSFEAHRGQGSLLVHASLRGLSTSHAQLEGQVDAKALTLTRNGMDLATVTFGIKASGGYQDRKLDARLDVPSGLVRLTDKLPRELQSLEQRPDIVVGRRPPPKKQAASPATAAAEGRPLTVAVRLVAPGRFLVQRENPRMRLELKADVSYERQGSADYVTGAVEVVRGTVEPLTDRRFEVKRGRVVFTGGPPKAAQLDIEAVWENPTANVSSVTVTVLGPATKPDITLRSQPPYDEGQIALLVATGQLDLRPGQGGGAGSQPGSGSQPDVGRAAAQKLGFAVFNTFIRDQLPFTSGDVSLDASAAKVSGYIPGTRIFVGYTRRFDANRQQGENEDEVRLEYAITPHWTLEGRYGNANTGDASLIWSKDY